MSGMTEASASRKKLRCATPGRNEYRNDKDQCVCKRGYERDKNGRCVE